VGDLVSLSRFLSVLFPSFDEVDFVLILDYDDKTYRQPGTYSKNNFTCMAIEDYRHIYLDVFVIDNVSKNDAIQGQAGGAKVTTPGGKLITLACPLKYVNKPFLYKQ
jgi:hypothetical protein